jgi:hypothetical protein
MWDPPVNPTAPPRNGSPRDRRRPWQTTTLASSGPCRIKGQVMGALLSSFTTIAHTKTTSVKGKAGANQLPPPSRLCTAAGILSWVGEACVCRQEVVCGVYGRNRPPCNCQLLTWVRNPPWVAGICSPAKHWSWDTLALPWHGHEVEDRLGPSDW